MASSSMSMPMNTSSVIRSPRSGYPVIDESLRLPKLPIFVTGRLTTSILGPAAGNLWGAQRAAQRIANTVATTT